MKKKTKPIQTRDLDLSTADQEPRPGTPGPQSADLGRPADPRAYVMRHATGEELARFAAAVAKRKAKEPTVRWWKCNACGRGGAYPFAVEPSNCLRCNWQNRENGGRMVLMTDTEARSWKTEQAAAERAHVGRIQHAAWTKTNAERAAAGCQPVSFQDWLNQANADWKARQDRDRIVGDAFMARLKNEGGDHA